MSHGASTTGAATRQRAGRHWRQISPHKIVQAGNMFSRRSNGVVCLIMPKGCVWRPCCTLLLQRGAAGRPIIVDPKVRDFGLYRGATVLTPNVAEVERGQWAHRDQPEALAQAVQTLLAAQPG